MRILIVLCLIGFTLAKLAQSDDDFEEFDFVEETPTATKSHQILPEETIEEEFDEEPVSEKTPTKSPASLDLDNEEFEHFFDDEEFENPTQQPKKKEEPVNLKINQVPIHLMSSGNWTNYVYEIVMLGVIAIYLAFYLVGKSKNSRFVHAWYQANLDLLEKNFSLVGDDGQSSELNSSSEQGTFIKDSDNSYGLWCSGRQGCEGLLIQLKLIKRQDLINGMVMQMIKPKSDQLIFSVEYPNKEDIDSFVFCLTGKKQSQQMFNDYQDLSSFCVEKKLSSSVQSQFVDLLSAQVNQKYVVLNEIGEIPNYMLDKTVCAFMNKYPEMVDFILVSDQYTGFRSQSEEQPVVVDGSSVGLPKSKSVLVISFNVPGKGMNTSVEDMESMLPALQLALYLIDRVPRIRLSKEAKTKAIKKRKDISEQLMKFKHKERQEAAMLRKEEKRRAEKEKIMNESDPEKQKKMEERELKREKKKNMSKMKQVKIMSM
ncbi:Coiled-coil domain-containing 47 [Brachionus plicatilis]|uniref:PAT complex subunit CCDC47 n=1 Tax=Brachionus plicatilis TaxID=10195 RepID=A0A3M7RSG2_BRAPC|nr:Coiled-coil domain-containing 47 [Brachionus plicatilis]